MKYVKMLGLAAAAAMALMAFLGASSASATFFCKTAETTACAEGWIYSAGTEIDASLEAGSSATLSNTSTSIEDTCTESTIKGSMSNSGITETVKINVTTANLTFGGCAHTTDVLEGGELEVHAIAGTDNFTLTAKGFKVTMILAGVTCTYTAGASTDLGTLTSGSMATMDINGIVNKSAGSFLCPSTAIWEAAYTVTSPEPLY